jgi:hypothetical protein
MFPFLANVFLTRKERELKRNCIAVRNLVGDLVDKRKAENEAKCNLKEDDLMSILIKDPIFADDKEVIIDELLTIFFAGS